VIVAKFAELLAQEGLEGRPPHERSTVGIGRPIRSRVAEDRSAEASTTGRDRTRLVRAGSVSQRSTRGIGGRQRSLTVQRNRRSEALWLTQLG
jgi:hypothetical protein